MTVSIYSIFTQAGHVFESTKIKLLSGLITVTIYFIVIFQTHTALRFLVNNSNNHFLQECYIIKLLSDLLWRKACTKKKTKKGTRSVTYVICECVQ